MDTLSAVIWGFLDTSREIIHTAVDSFCITLSDSRGKVSAEEAIIRATQEAFGRACEVFWGEEEVPLEQAPEVVTTIIEGEEQVVILGGEMSDGGEEEEDDIIMPGAEGVVEAEVGVSSDGAGASDGQLTALCEELAALMGATASEIRAAAELEMAEMTSASAAVAEMEPPHSHQEEAHQSLTAPVVHTMATIQGGGMFSGDSYTLPDTLDDVDVFSGPFDHEALPSPRDALPPLITPSSVTPLRVEPPSQPVAASPTDAASLETTSAAPPLEQDFALPDSLGECLPAEVHADLHRAAEMGDAETEAAAAAYAQAAEEEAPQTWDAETEAAASAYTQAAEEEALRAQQLHEYQTRYLELMQSMPAEFAPLARCVSYYPEEALHLGGQLGEGGQGKVFGVQAYDSSGTSTVMALKVARDSSQDANLYTEAYHLIMCRDSRIVSLCGFTLIGGVRLALLFQLADPEPTWKSREQSTPEQLSYIVKQLKEVAAGLVFLHGQGYLYNDLKPDNILLVNGLAKIADLGLMCRQQDGHLRGGAGTPGYIPPEVDWYKCNTVAGDVFAFGMLIHSVVTDTRPFYEIRDQQLTRPGGWRLQRDPWL